MPLHLARPRTARARAAGLIRGPINFGRSSPHRPIGRLTARLGRSKPASAGSPPNPRFISSLVSLSLRSLSFSLAPTAPLQRTTDGGQGSAKAWPETRTKVAPALALSPVTRSPMGERVPVEGIRVGALCGGRGRAVARCLPGACSVLRARRRADGGDGPQKVGIHP